MFLGRYRHSDCQLTRWRWLSCLWVTFENRLHRSCGELASHWSNFNCCLASPSFCLVELKKKIRSFSRLTIAVMSNKGGQNDNNKTPVVGGKLKHFLQYPLPISPNRIYAQTYLLVQLLKQTQLKASPLLNWIFSTNFAFTGKVAKTQLAPWTHFLLLPFALAGDDFGQGKWWFPLFLAAAVLLAN